MNSIVRKTRFDSPARPPAAKPCPVVPPRAGGHRRHVLRNALLALGLLVLCSGPWVVAGPSDIPQSFHSVTVNSGLAPNPQSATQVVFSQVIDLGNVPWTRVFFDSVILEGDSYLRITSQYDGESQVLNRQTLAEWQNSTAYFNGPAVTVCTPRGWHDCASTRPP